MRREIERAVEGYEARESLADLAGALVRGLVTLPRLVWRLGSTSLHSLRVRWSIRVARSVYISGPMRIGDEHPTLKGWFYTGKRNRTGALLWYRPPGLVSRWVRRVGLFGYLGFIAFAITVACLFGRH